MLSLDLHRWTRDASSYKAISDGKEGSPGWCGEQVYPALLSPVAPKDQP